VTTLEESGKQKMGASYLNKLLRSIKLADFVRPVAPESPQPSATTPPVAPDRHERRAQRAVQSPTDVAAPAAKSPRTHEGELSVPDGPPTFDDRQADTIFPGFRPIQTDEDAERYEDIGTREYPHESTPDLTSQTEEPAVFPARRLDKTAIPPTPVIAEHARNGFVPRSDDGARPSNKASIGNLLERMRYEAQKDGSVLYLVDNVPAFRDHGDQLLMVPAADKNEDAIVAAILLAKEKYGGAFEITGDATFKRRVIELMVKYDLKARLKDPEQDAQHRELARSVPLPAHPRATPEHPTRPVDLIGAQDSIPSESAIPLAPPLPSDLAPAATRPEPRSVSKRATAVDASMDGTPSRASNLANDTPLIDGSPAAQTAEAMSDEPASRIHGGDPVNRLEGEILDFARAPFHDEIENTESFYVTLKNSDGVIRKTWGIDLERAIEKTGVDVGDHVRLQKLGRKPVTVNEDVRDKTGRVISTRDVLCYKVLWEVELPRPVPALTPLPHAKREPNTKRSLKVTQAHRGQPHSTGSESARNPSSVPVSEHAKQRRPMEAAPKRATRPRQRMTP